MAGVVFSAMQCSLAAVNPTPLMIPVDYPFPTPAAHTLQVVEHNERGRMLRSNGAICMRHVLHGREGDIEGRGAWRDESMEAATVRTEQCGAAGTHTERQQMVK